MKKPLCSTLMIALALVGGNQLRGSLMAAPRAADDVCKLGKDVDSYSGSPITGLVSQVLKAENGGDDEECGDLKDCEFKVKWQVQWTTGQIDKVELTENGADAGELDFGPTDSSVTREVLLSPACGESITWVADFKDLAGATVATLTQVANCAACPTPL